MCRRSDGRIDATVCDDQRVLRLGGAATSWVFRHSRVLVVTLAHVVVDAVVVASVVGAFRGLPALGFISLLPALYVVSFAGVFADAVIVVAAHQSANGEAVSVGRATRTAWAHRQSLAVWTLHLIAVGLAIRLVTALLGRLGELLGLTAAIAWTIVTLIVVPEIVVGGQSSPAAFRRSRELVRTTLGGRVRAVVDVGVLWWLAFVPSVLLCIGGALADSGPLIVLGAFLFVLAIALQLFILDTALAVLSYALFATAGGTSLPSGFDREVIRRGLGGTSGR